MGVHLHNRTLDESVCMGELTVRCAVDSRDVPSATIAKSITRRQGVHMTPIRRVYSVTLPLTHATFLLVAAECAALGVFTAELDSTDTHEIELGDGGLTTRLELLERA